MRTYVVGLDGSEHAQASLDWAQAVAGPDDAIIVAHAWELPVVTGYETVPTVDPMTVEQVSEEFLDTALSERADPRITGHLVTGHPGRNLVDLAEEAAGEGREVTIVVGHGGSSKASLLLGSTANYVIHHTAAAVVVVRGALRLPVRRVAVGVDEGERDDPDAHSLAALRWAVNLPGVERIDVAHADFVPAVAAGPVREPGLESDEAVAEDNQLLARVIDRATDGAGVPPNGAADRARRRRRHRRVRVDRSVPRGRPRGDRHPRPPWPGRADPRLHQPRRHRARPLPGGRRPLTRFRRCRSREP